MISPFNIKKKERPNKIRFSLSKDDQTDQSNSYFYFNYCEEARKINSLIHYNIILFFPVFGPFVLPFSIFYGKMILYEKKD